MSEALAGRRVTDQFWQSLFSREKADLAIQCSDDVEIWCNRTALAAASHYFQCLLGSDWQEGRAACVKLKSVNSHLMQAYLLDFFKTGKLRFGKLT